jgi:hypothetical protein
MGGSGAVTALPAYPSGAYSSSWRGPEANWSAFTSPRLREGRPLIQPSWWQSQTRRRRSNLSEKSAAHNEEVEAIGPVPERVVKLFELKAGQFTPWRYQEPNETQQPSEAPKSRRAQCQ